MTQMKISSGMRGIVALRDVGCTGVTLRVVAELHAVGHDPRLVRERLTWFRHELSGYATLWHLERAVDARRADLPAALTGFADRLRADARAAAATAAALLAQRAGGFGTAPSSGLVREVLDRVAALDGPAGSGRGEPLTGVAGADAIGPDTVLNAVGTKDLAARLPTVVVTTSTRLVPSDVFSTLHSPLFEHIPLDSFETLVVDGEALTPAETGRRAATEM